MDGDFCAVGVGLMSGTSCDGVDLCRVQFKGNLKTEQWAYDILEATTVPYDDLWKKRLADFDRLSGYQLIRMHFEYGHLLGKILQTFIADKAVDFVCSHGHTVFHKPEEKVTFQMGDGETMATYLQQPLVTSLRYKDVALGGQGAPIVPFSEKRLFASHDICVNLGGICNIAMQGLGFDIAPCNMALNVLAQLHDSKLEFDESGKIAQSGTVIDHMLATLNGLAFYQQRPPKSLGREWFEDNVAFIINENCSKYPAKDLLRTFVEHIAIQIAYTIKTNHSETSTKSLSILFTGGGSLNSFLLQKIEEHLKKLGVRYDIPDVDENVVQYKEAIIMAFMGMYALLKRENVQAQGTGASKDTISGSIHWPPSWSEKCDKKWGL